MNERELSWDSTIEKESDFVLLPAGDYQYTITAMERARHGGSDKLPACPKAIVHIRIEDGINSTTIKHNLFLHTITEGLLSQFFIGIGQKKHGEALRMNWDDIIGRTGKCKVEVDSWTSKKGEVLKNNKISKFYEPQQKTFKEGDF